MGETEKSLSIEDIADQCGVSVSTVSRALNNEPGISSDTRQRVINVARKNNFTLQKRKRSLKRSNLDLVVVVPEEEEMSVNPFFNIAELLGAINEAFMDEKRRVEVVTPESFSTSYSTGPLSLDGVIIAYRVIDDAVRRHLVDNGVPYVFLSRTISNDNYVSCNGIKGIMKLARLLMESGHSRIGYLGNSSNPNNLDRYRGYRISLIEAELLKGGDTALMYRSIRDVNSQTARFFIDKKCDAVMCYNDFMAIELVKEFKKKGVAVPGDISVTGFDDSPLSRVFSPSITTVQMPTFEMAFLAARWLRDNIMNRRKQNLKIEMDGRIIVRDSARINGEEWNE